MAITGISKISIPGSSPGRPAYAKATAGKPANKMKKQIEFGETLNPETMIEWGVRVLMEGEGISPDEAAVRVRNLMPERTRPDFSELPVLANIAWLRRERKAG